MALNSLVSSIDRCLDLLVDFEDVETKEDEADSSQQGQDKSITTSQGAPSKSTSNKREESKDNDAESESESRPKVLVSGCFDLLHSGHIEFFNQAAEYGDLYVRLGTDANIELLKHHKTMYDEQERLFMVRNLKSVYNAELSQGSGMFDWETDMKILKPRYYFLNEDASELSERYKICEKYNKNNPNYPCTIVVKKRKPNEKLAARSSTDLKAKLSRIHSKEAKKINDNVNSSIHENHLSNHIQIANDLKNIELYNQVFPWRFCFAGGWLDLAWCNRYYPGCVITINVKYNKLFEDYCGLATSSRKTAIQLWNGQLPSHLDAIKAAKYLWGTENFDHFGSLEKKYIAGSQDHCGLFLPGINKLEYNVNKQHANGCHWPDNIINLNDINDEKQFKIFQFLENVLYVVKSPNYFGRQNVESYNSQKINHLKDENVSINEKEKMVKNLSLASELAWQGIVNMDIDKLGKGLSDTMKAWEEMLPYTVNPCDDNEQNDKIKKYWKQYDIPYTKGCLFSGAGGGFIFVINDKPIENSFKIKINHDHLCKHFPSNII